MESVRTAAEGMLQACGAKHAGPHKVTNLQLSMFRVTAAVECLLLLAAAAAAAHDSFSQAKYCGKFAVNRADAVLQEGCITIRTGLARTVVDLQLQLPMKLPFAPDADLASTIWSTLNRWQDPRGHTRPWNDFCCTIVMDWESARQDFALAQTAGNAEALLQVAEGFAPPSHSSTQNLGEVLARLRPIVWLLHLGFFCATFGELGTALHAGVAVSQRWWLGAGTCWTLVPALWHFAARTALHPLHSAGGYVPYSPAVSFSLLCFAGPVVVAASGLSLYISAFNRTRMSTPQSSHSASDPQAPPHARPAAHAAPIGTEKA